MNIDRRNFIKNYIGKPAVIAGVNLLAKPITTLANVIEEKNASRGSLLKILSTHNVEVADDFKNDELSDIISVLNLYEQRIGDLKRYNFNFKHSYFDSSDYNNQIKKDPRKKGHKFAGYFYRGFCSPETQKIKIAPKHALDDLNDWEYKYGKVPIGEEGRIHDFKETLIHEISHSLAFKLYSDAMYSAVWMPSKNDPKFLHEWYKLSRICLENAYQIGKSRGRDFNNERPVGYPTNNSYYGSPHEGFAGCATYLISNANYADCDELLMERIGLIGLELNRIKKERPPLNIFK